MGMQMRCRHRYVVLRSTCPVLDSTQLGKDHGQRIRNRSLSMLACTVIPAGRFAAPVVKGTVVLVSCRRDAGIAMLFCAVHVRRLTARSLAKTTVSA